MKNINKGKTIIINESMMNDIKDLMSMTQFKFKSNIKKFLAGLLEDPSGTDIDDIFKFNGLDKNKLIKSLVDNKVIKKKMTIDDHDEDGNPHKAKMIIRYSVPKERFNDRLDALYDVLFPDAPAIINEDGGGATNCSGVDGNGFGSGEFITPLTGVISRTGHITHNSKKKKKKTVGGDIFTEQPQSVCESKKLISTEEAEKNGFAVSDSDIKYGDNEFIIPKNIGTGYKVFFQGKDGNLYPPMIANDGGKPTPIGKWLPASSPIIVGYTEKEHRPQVKSGGNGTKGGSSGNLAFRPGWHMGEIPYAKQFIKKNKINGREVWPKELIWAECEYSNDIDYQDEAMSYGYTKNGKFLHSRAGLPKIPKNGSYRYRTNPKPDTVPWIISGAMRVKNLLSFDEVDEILKDNNIEPPIVMSNAEYELRNKTLNEAVTGEDVNKSAALYVYNEDKDHNWYILCARRSNRKDDEEGGKWNPPMGHLHKGETLKDGALRECFEESGIDLSKYKDKLVKKDNHDWGSNFVIKLGSYVKPEVTIDDFEPKKGDEENSKFIWLRLEDIDKKTWAWTCGENAKKFIPGEIDLIQESINSIVSMIIKEATAGDGVGPIQFTVPFGTKSKLDPSLDRSPGNVCNMHDRVGSSNLEEGRKKIVKNDEGNVVPDNCDKCGGEVVLQIHGEPVYVCKECGKYFGTMPCNIGTKKKKKKGKKVNE